MGWFSRLFSTNKKEIKEVITTPQGPALTMDMHAHFLPELDDGASSLDESMAIIKGLHQLGYKHLVATPHIMSDFYKNTPEGIGKKVDLVKKEIAKENIDITIEFAAEYYLDDGFLLNLRNKKPFLTFGKNYLLIETSFINPCLFIDEAIFMAISQGYQPIIAHPERYSYVFDDYEEIKRWKNIGAMLQINALSLLGYYSSKSKNIAERLINDNLVDFIGTDCHKPKHLEGLKKVLNSSYYNKSLGLNLKNNQIATF
ncbi:tyrosine-protein phosphatase [Flammeovirga sp. EKP202]|uniref:tyrosine-protein phosphatase n=1 Tax=Flammeovirga sp. EKP202 TaxID=2770592 RepID=UPI00165F1038|nr:CpsB/CapC family capsule biosynthesis tyrosine phosphatase [Flammeovirga sp. EKP202]MBD0403123.1 capsular biosynthesis protein [Flammeovirga sp. EKP202]